MGLNLEKRSHCDDKINYNRSNAESAIRCLKDLQTLEDTPNFGVLNYNSSNNLKNNRYDEPVYDGKIDSTFYTDMATATLAYTMKAFYDSFGDRFSVDVVAYIENYFTYGSHDLVNDSSGEYADFEGDMSLFDANLHVADSLYAYYNEYQLVDNGYDISRINSITYLDGDEPKIVLKKTDNINGVDMDFYYVGVNFNDFSTKLLQHDYNANFLEERMPGEVLEAVVSKTGNNEIVTVTENIYNEMNTDKGYVAYACYWRGAVVVRDDYFTDAICHEIGHLFDYVDCENPDDFYESYDYDNNTGTWDKLAEKYAGDIALIGLCFGIGGYLPSSMRKMHYEFYAEAFQLYFYSPETRAALPKEVRDAIEQELEMYT